MYTHTNPWGRLKWPYAITRLTAHFVCGLMADLVICKSRKSMVVHDTECPYWDQVSLNNTKPNLFTEWNTFKPSKCATNINQFVQDLCALHVHWRGLLFTCFRCVRSETRPCAINVMTQIIARVMNCRAYLIPREPRAFCTHLKEQNSI